MLGLLRNWSEIGKLPAALREELETEGIIFAADKVAVSRRFGGHVPGVYSAAGVARYTGAFAFTAARVVATFPTRGDAALRSIDCSWDARVGSATATITDNGLKIDIALHRVDPVFSGAMSVNYKKAIPAEVLDKVPATTLRFAMDPVFVYRAAGVRPRP